MEYRVKYAYNFQALSDMTREISYSPVLSECVVVPPLDEEQSGGSHSVYPC